MTDTDGVRNLFDGLASEYDCYLPFFERFGSALVRWWRPRLGQRVLDVGAGRGAITAPAAHIVGSRGHVLAIDNAEGMLTLLARDCVALPQVDVRVMDAHRLEQPTASFDVVTCGFILHFLNDPAQAIAEAYRVLRPDGLLVFSGPPTQESSSSQPDTRWDFYRQLMDEFTRRADGSDRSELFGGPSRPLPTLCSETGFIAIEQCCPRMLFSFRGSAALLELGDVARIPWIRRLAWIGAIHRIPGQTVGRVRASAHRWGHHRRARCRVRSCPKAENG